MKLMLTYKLISCLVIMQSIFINAEEMYMKDSAAKNQEKVC